MYEPCNEITPLVEVYQRWLNDQTRLAVRYGFSTRKTHGWHILTTSGITLAEGRQLTIVVPSCLLSVSPEVAQAGNERVFSVVVDMNSLRTYPQLPGILLSECARLRLAGLFNCLERVFSCLKTPGQRESLTLLCWYELINDRRDGNWQDLVTLNEREVAAWLACHLARYPLLHRMVDEYVFFACAGFWSDN
ncbi:hypothetical protein D9P64_08930 [Salmonella enterica subsp. enterica serovar Kibi]|uniref:Malate transporter n=2 Tax=Salmonella enterica TaxID=28901 RepID=A0A5W3RLY0_SALET|nr:hypothetical protein [Salmonella enterica]EBU8205961.1 hypothetical protein [Salmonella enterica subsp. enterica serovar Cardoner]EBZ2860448.1 hypothetical protein [Salmonella enterica subsp. enterica serovar Kibi]ECC2976343.1 hypothetical protein [Salmonella enterica subsp. enterica]EDS3573835.1 hypothetical protein [Salmonella enterica subsp. enterica serovar Sangera]EEE8154629.1 hypothetical protein [Salmonella enterica subsp. enterica serovar Badagry]EEI6325113.1 hypothetical protein [